MRHYVLFFIVWIKLFKKKVDSTQFLKFYTPPAGGTIRESSKVNLAKLIWQGKTSKLSQIAKTEPKNKLNLSRTVIQMRRMYYEEYVMDSKF
jgi:hypothetical protein